ncbi:excisionase family DNA-binding protein [uncultured Marivita sp.]|uniref:excisionase family DNA-binding protein n=1 Tax=uncultured Marivita sp. TaxID=888080 RepID=UPI00343E3618
MLPDPPFTPDTLAARWGCSSETIRQMINRGELQAFRLGRLYRIPNHIVEAYECQNSKSDACAEVAPSLGTKTENASVISLSHVTSRKRKQKP